MKKILVSTALSAATIAAANEMLAASRNSAGLKGAAPKVVVDPTGQAVEAILAKAANALHPMADATLCYLAYQAALALAAGNPILEAIARVAYEQCLKG